MTFSDLAKTFEQIESTSSRNEITEILADTYKKLKPNEAKYVSYLVLGRIAPLFEPVEFNMGDKTLLKVIGLAFDKSEKEVLDLYKQTGDLGDTAAFFNPKKRSEITIEEVFKRLTAVAHLEGSGSVEKKIQDFAQLVSGLDTVSSKYLMRIPVGRLRLGFSEMTILDSLSYMIHGDKSQRETLESAFNVFPDIGEVARALKIGGITAVENIEAEVGVPIRSALPERLHSAREIFDKIGSHYADLKVDGFRAQIHMDKSRKITRDVSQKDLFGKKESVFIKIYSRNMEDTTDMFPEIVEAVQKLPVDSIILDTEAVGYNPETKTPVVFQETMKRKRKYGIETSAGKIPLKDLVFDLLYLNGKSLISEEFRKRRDLIRGIIPVSDTINQIPAKEINKVEDLEGFWTRSVRDGFEGVICKRPDAKYTPGKRNFNWIKLKKVNQSTLDDTIDCVVMGYYLGRGARVKFGIGGFLVGVYNRKEDAYESISKVGTGLSDKEWRKMKEDIDKIKEARMPSNYKVNSNLYCDVWAKPSIVVEIKADEITKSTVHSAAVGSIKGGGLALRFPRLEKIRKKQPTEATTTEEVIKLHKAQG